MMEFTVLKTKVKISPLFFAVLTAFLIADRNGIAPVVIGFSLVHELCHFAALAAIKTAPQEVTVSAAGIFMSLNEGMSTVKKILVFAPDVDMEKILRERSLPLFALESGAILT